MEQTKLYVVIPCYNEEQVLPITSKLFLKARELADITISIDCDGQDDITAMEAMVDAYHDGAEIVYGVRSKRITDSFFKRFTAETFYKLLNRMGVESVYNHADYRLVVYWENISERFIWR